MKEYQEPLKIYVITKGEYSDYGIVAVTTDYERAENLKKLFSSPYEKANIETYIDNLPTEEGELFRVDLCADGCICIEPAIILPPKEKIGKIIKNGASLYMYVRAKDKQHAKKIFYDKRAEYLAQKNGIS